MQVGRLLSSDVRDDQSMTRTAMDALLFAMSTVVCFFVAIGITRVLHSPERGLPYHDQFASGDNSEWTAFGGNWRVQTGTMRNESNERGAKLISGSAYWQDYTVQADVALSSPGDAGLIARVSDPEQGVDAYHGIYGGLRMRDQALVLGVADHSWDEVAVRTLTPPIVPNAWYHIRMEIKGCRVRAMVNAQGSMELARLDVVLNSCPERGKIGLRSYDSGGLWRNVQVTAVTEFP